MTTSSLPSSPPRPGFPGPALALLLYVFLTAALTWPALRHLEDGLPAGGNDLWQNYWNFWWWQTALEEGKSPYATDMIYQPGSVSLAFHTHSEANIILILPLLFAFGAACALNTAVLLGFVFASWGGYLLARELVGNAKAAFVGGVVLAFFPYHFEQSLEHLNLVSYQAMPFFLYFLIKLVRQGGWGNVILTALFFALNSLYSWHNGLIILPLALCLFFHELRSAARPRRTILRDAVLSGSLAAFVLLPFAWPMLREILAGDTSYLKPLVKKGIDPLFLIVPPERHPVWGGIFQGLYERFRGYASAGFTCYLGIIPLGLWAASLKNRKQLPIFWTALFLIHLLFALGDPLTIGGQETGLRLPFAVMKHVPLFRTLRVANRFVVPAMVAFSVLAAYGTMRFAAKRGAFPLILGLVILDFLWLPYPLQEIARPKWIEQISSAPPGLLLDIPGGYRARGAEDMFYQALHHRPTVGGYSSCIPPSIEKRVEELPFLKLIFEGRPEVQVEIEGGLKQTLTQLPVGVVVVHLQRTRENLERLYHAGNGRQFNPEKGIAAETLKKIRAALRTLWGEPYYKDAEVELFGKPGKLR